MPSSPTGRSEPPRRRGRHALAVAALSILMLAVPASAHADPVIAAAGDIACKTAPLVSGSSCHYGTTSDLVVADPSISDVLVLGDIQYECGDYPFFLSRYGTTWGRFKAITHPALGNHEYRTTASYTTCDPGTSVPTQGYFDYFNGVGVQAGPAGERGKGYYSFDVGAWHLIALNSNCGSVSCSATSAQATWLKADLAAHPAVCTLAFWHHPRYSSGSYPSSSTQPLWQLLYDAHADVVLVGHEHMYERFARLGRTPTTADKYEPVLDANGIRSFTVGTGGRSHQFFAKTRTGSEVRDATTFGILKMTLHPSSYDWRFVPESGSTFTDSGSDTCVQAPAPDTTPPAPPANVAASASPGSIGVTWSASTDPSGVPKYDVYRGIAGGARTRVATVTTTSYTDTAVTPGTTYDYAVRAIDGAGNVSGDSAVASATAAAATTLTFAPAADARVEQANPTANFGTVSPLSSDAGSTTKQSYVRFAVSGLAGRTVQRAVVRLYVTNGAPDGPAMYRVSDTTWGETAITWNTKPALGAQLDDKGLLTSSTFVDYDVTAAFAGGGDGAYGFGIGVTPTTDGVDFRSKEATSNRPQLILTVG